MACTLLSARIRREVRLSGCWVVIRPVAVQHGPPGCERLSRPPRASEEGTTGESGPLNFSGWSCTRQALACRHADGANERRLVLMLQYVTGQRMGPLKKVFSNTKDAFAYFGPAALMPDQKRSRSSHDSHTYPAIHRFTIAPSRPSFPIVTSNSLDSATR